MWIPKKKLGNHLKRNKKAIEVYKTTERLILKNEHNTRQIVNFDFWKNKTDMNTVWSATKLFKGLPKAIKMAEE